MGWVRHDPTTWPRASAYAHYRHMAQPHMAVTVEVDVTTAVAACRAEGRSVFAGLMHGLVGAVQAVPALRQRIRFEGGEHVVEHDRVDPAFTVAVAGGRFGFATVPYVDDPVAFSVAVREASEAQHHIAELQPFEGVRDDVVYMSCLPWLSFTSLTHPVHASREGFVDDVPRIAWGKLTERDGRQVMPVNLQVHHALVDGRHLGAFFEAVEAGWGPA